MKLLRNNKGWPLLRLIVPAFPQVNIFTQSAKETTPLGPINVATSANKVWGWRAEVIDENNYDGPRDEKGLTDHERLQKENPASVVGFYCGLSSTMDRAFELTEFYHNQGAVNIAGGWHAHYCPEEVLNRHVDIVVHGDGETVIQQILTALMRDEAINNIPGISFWENGRQKSNSPAMLQVPDLSDLPYPDFGLLRYAKKIKTYPIGRVRGCGMNCEFCSVKGKPRWASPQYMFHLVKWLVETRGARHFFIVDDRFEENIEGAAEFFRLIYAEYGDRLDFMVQIRLETARNVPFLETMRKAGMRSVAVGYESPIDEDLKAMRKGYLSHHMIEWTKVLRHYFWVHAMFIYGYPSKEKRMELTPAERIKRFKTFIRKSQVSTIQVLHPVPIVGSDLRTRLGEENRIFPLDIVPWSKYDGNYACFVPDNMSLSEFQDTPIALMKWFYNWFNFLKIPYRTIAFPVLYPIKGWQRWYHDWLREIVRYGGHRLLRRWQKKQNNALFLGNLAKYKPK